MRGKCEASGETEGCGCEIVRVKAYGSTAKGIGYMRAAVQRARVRCEVRRIYRGGLVGPWDSGFVWRITGFEKDRL